MSGPARPDEQPGPESSETINKTKEALFTCTSAELYGCQSFIPCREFAGPFIRKLFISSRIGLGYRTAGSFKASPKCCEWTPQSDARSKDLLARGFKYLAARGSSRRFPLLLWRRGAGRGGRRAQAARQIYWCGNPLACRHEPQHREG